jgi:beta-N-acetylhexosaminidase
VLVVRWLHVALLALTAAIGTTGARRPQTGAAGGWTRAQCSPDAQVEAMLAILSPEQQVGQLFMVGLLSGDGTGAVDTAIARDHAGNVVLYGTGWFGADFVGQSTTYLTGLAQANNRGIAPFISGNQEGGTNGSLQAFYGPGFSDIVRASRQAAAAGNDPSVLQGQAKVWGTELWNAGVNLDLAPVLDTVPPELLTTNEPIGRLGREYGTDPATVSMYGLAFMHGMHDAGVAVAVKHFPGLGRVTGNTDFTAQGTEDTAFSGASDPFLQPFRDAINAGTDFVMVSSATYPRVSQQRAVFSSTIVTNLLRQTLGFTGVIITDDVGAAAAVADLTPAERALDFFRAGGDMVLTVAPSDIGPMTRATLAAMDADPAFAAQITQSVRRVLTAKANYGLLPPSC